MVGVAAEYSPGVCAPCTDPGRGSGSEPVSDSAADREKCVVQHPVRDVLTHLDAGGIGEPEVDAEPDPGIDHVVVELAGRVEVARCTSDGRLPEGHVQGA